MLDGLLTAPLYAGAARTPGGPGPDHGVICRLVHSGRRKVLLAQAEGADLLVVDAPRQPDLAGDRSLPTG